MIWGRKWAYIYIYIFLFPPLFIHLYLGLVVRNLFPRKMFLVCIAQDDVRSLHYTHQVWDSPGLNVHMNIMHQRWYFLFCFLLGCLFVWFFFLFSTKIVGSSVLLSFLGLLCVCCFSNKYCCLFTTVLFLFIKSLVFLGLQYFPLYCIFSMHQYNHKKLVQFNFANDFVAQDDIRWDKKYVIVSKFCYFMIKKWYQCAHLLRCWGPKWFQSEKQSKIPWNLCIHVFFCLFRCVPRKVLGEAFRCVPRKVLGEEEMSCWF